MLTTQLATLKAAIAAETDSAFVANRQAGATGAMADFYNTDAVGYWVWRTNVQRAEIYHSTSPDATTWNWTTYKQQSVTEQGAWVQMFMGDFANFSLPNLRAGVSAIFTGSAPQVAQATHVLSVGRRLATRGEKLYASGAGTTANPSTMVFEGRIRDSDVVAALSS